MVPTRDTEEPAWRWTPDMSPVDVHVVPSDDPPTDVGEPGLPPLAPAMANAVFAPTGKPVEALPIRL